MINLLTILKKLVPKLNYVQQPLNSVMSTLFRLFNAKVSFFKKIYGFKEIFIFNNDNDLFTRKYCDLILIISETDLFH